MSRRSIDEAAVSPIWSKRWNRLLPNGWPRWLKLYDNGGKSKDCYFAVFTKGRPGYWRAYQTVSFNAVPNHPQMGIYMHNEYTRPGELKLGAHLGKRIDIQELPPDCVRAIYEEYCYWWDLEVPLWVRDPQKNNPKYRQLIVPRGMIKPRVTLLERIADDRKLLELGAPNDDVLWEFVDDVWTRRKGSVQEMYRVGHPFSDDWAALQKWTAFDGWRTIRNVDLGMYTNFYDDKTLDPSTKRSIEDKP